MVAIVVHVDDMFRVGQKARCDQFGEDFNDMLQVKNLCELRWYCGCFMRGFGRRECYPFLSKRLLNSVRTNTGEVR